MRLRNLHWFSDGLLPLAVCGMETAWAFPVVQWISAWPFLNAGGRSALSWPVLFGVLAFATFTTRVSLKQDWAIRRVQRVVVAAAILSLLATMRLEYYPAAGLLDPGWLADLARQGALGFTAFPLLGATLLIGVYLWRRGIGIARSPLAFDDVAGYFLTGIVALVGLLVVAPLLPVADAASLGGAGSGISVVAFFFCSLIALALARLELVRQAQRTRDGAAVGFTRQWLALLLAAVAGVLLVAVLAASSVSFDLVAALAAPLGWAADLLFAVLWVVLLGAGFVAEALVYALRFLVSLAGIRRMPDRPPSPPDFSDLQHLAEGKEPVGLPPEAVLAVKWGLLALVGAVILVLLLRAVFRYWSGPQDESDEVRESVWSWPDLWAAFRDALSQWGRRLLGRRQRPTQTMGWTGAAPRRDEPAVRSVRAIYRQLLQWTAAHGIRRKADQTPYEYLDDLRQALPGSQQEVDTITGAYVWARYSPRAPGVDEVEALAAAWDRLRQRLEAWERRDGTGR